MRIKKPKFDQTPTCEVCRKQPATFFCSFKNKDFQPPPVAEDEELFDVIDAVDLMAKSRDDTYAEDMAARAKEKGSRRWQFTCDECANSGYQVETWRFFHSPASTVDWIAHLHEKSWMDWDDFALMMWRFREATQSYGKE